MDKQITQPSKKDRMIADESFRLLQSSLEKLKSDNPEIEIEETGEKIKIPKSALELLVKILGEMKKGKPL
ncbi:MAG: excisionase, partial [Marinoscillum sp.]